jgi:hypothetical protein
MASRENAAMAGSGKSGSMRSDGGNLNSPAAGRVFEMDGPTQDG